MIIMVTKYTGVVVVCGVIFYDCHVSTLISYLMKLCVQPCGLVVRVSDY